MRLHHPVLVPGRKQHSTVATPVLDVLEGVHHVWNKAKTPSKEKADKRPDTKCEALGMNFFLHNSYSRGLTEWYFRHGS